MKGQQTNVEDGGFRYRINGEKAEITGCERCVARMEVPAWIEGYPVKSIARKAFLSRKDLYVVMLPESIEEVGDWAFANCTGLTEVFFPERNVRFGRAVFKNCGNLKKITVKKAGCGKCNREECSREEYDEEKNVMVQGEQEGGEPELLAAAVTLLDAYYLLDLPAAGSAEWLGKWDNKLSSVLRTSDQEGYISQSVYGEEDYIGTDLEEYISERRKEKVRLAFLRLLHPRELEPGLKEELETLLQGYARGCGGGETWQVLLGEYGDKREYYRLFADLSCIDGDNFDGILQDMGEDYPEMKAFFLKFREEQHGAGDFFQGLEL